MWQTKFLIFKNGIICYLCLGTTYAGLLPTAQLLMTQLVDLTYNTDYIERYDFRLIPYRGRNVLNGTIVYARNMSKINTRLVLDFERPDKTRFQMANITTDLCQLLNGEFRKNNVVKLLMKHLDNQRGYIQRCPIEAKREYDLIRCGAEPTEFPLPNLKFVVWVTMYDDEFKTKIVEYRIKGATKRKA